MIRHVVMWKVVGETAAEKQTAVEAIAGALEPLAHVIPGIASLKVFANVPADAQNYDAVLVGDYDSLEALEGYLVHPAHVAAVVIVRANSTARAAIDFELEAL
jgi:hypothetical protein